MLLNGGTGEQDCAHQASEWTNDMWASQVMGGNTRRPKLCMRICGPLHVLPCEPKVQDGLFFVQGVAASPLASSSGCRCGLPT